MKVDDVRGKEVYDTAGVKVGVVVGIDFKSRGEYAFVIKGELDEKQRAKDMEKFGVVEGGDTFEIPRELIDGIGEKIILKKDFDKMGKDIKVIRQV